MRQGDVVMNSMSRRDLLRMGVGASALGIASTALGMAGLAVPLSLVEAESGTGPESVQVAEIYQLQAAFHRAKSTQDLDLMLSLWASEGTLHIQGDPNSPYVGTDQLMSFWEHSGSFTHRRFSLVPSFKTQIRVNGDEAWLYFECHDVGDYDLATRFIAGDTFLAGTVRNVAGRWLFSNMTAGSSSPLSVAHYYFP